ncbi:phage tail protein [Carnobacterium maltaromaticum]|uniref:Phage tail protein n=1 Tax=Carnobacterium maltaromaticum TaxID=2751 RepID=A0AAW9K3T8_CARML|nr:phage tail protein [Carnobacterium maltaromaticum]MDZ5758042.1 phage tail protein [Carnobacterium maltaromaticum]
MGLKKEIPNWKNEGIEPSENIKIDGHKAGVKPPASLFNWFWFSVSEFLLEIKERVYTKDELYTKGEVDINLDKKADKSLFENHTINKNNPHSVNKIQVGLSNVDNIQQATKVEFESHVASKNNPHSVTKVQVGLSNVDNIQQATKAEFNSHNMDTTKHITATERSNWNSKATGDHSHNFSEIKNVPLASTSIQGVVKLSDSVVSVDITTAATPKSVKAAYDYAKSCEAALNKHQLEKNNPHEVTAFQVGAYSKTESYGKTELYNRTEIDKKVSDIISGNVLSATKLQTARTIAGISFDGTSNIVIPAANVGAYTKYETDLAISTHANLKNNPHSVTKVQVGLSNVDNIQQATKVEFNSHNMDTTKHITDTERSKWNAKQDVYYDSGWIKAVTSGVTHDTGKPLQYRKIGNRVIFRGGGTFPTAAGTTFLVMPEGFSPVGQPAFFDTTVRDSNPQHKCIVQVLTSSECKIITNSYAANPIFLDGFEYLID